MRKKKSPLRKLSEQTDWTYDGDDLRLVALFERLTAQEARLLARNLNWITASLAKAHQLTSTLQQMAQQAGWEAAKREVEALEGITPEVLEIEDCEMEPRRRFGTPDTE